MEGGGEAVGVALCLSLCVDYRWLRGILFKSLLQLCVATRPILNFVRT